MEEGSLRLPDNMRMIIDSVFRVTRVTVKVLFLVRGLQKCRGWNLYIEVARVLALNHDHLSWHTAHPVQSEYRPMCGPRRGRYFGSVGRVVFNWAYLHANKDDYERRI